MKRLLVLLVTGLSLAFCSDPDKNETIDFEVNGLKVILKQMPESDIISAGFYLNGGVSYADEINTGLEQLLIAVAPKGTENFDKETLQGITESIGTAIGGSAGRDYSSITLRCLKDHWEKSRGIYQDVILNPTLDSNEIELERAVQVSAIRAVKDDPDAYLGKLSNEFFYKGHPYERSPNGIEENVSAFTREDLLSWHKNNFAKSRALLVVVGPLTKKDLQPFVRAIAAGLPQGEPYTNRLPQNWEKSTSGMEVVAPEVPNPTNYVIGRANAPTRHSEDYFAFQLAARKLHTQVWEAVRTKRSLSYAPAAGYSGGNASSTYLYVTTTQPDSAIKVMYDEVNKLKETELTPEEVEELRMGFFTAFHMGQETAASVRGSLASYELSGYGYEKLDEFIDNINSVTAEDIQRVARKYMTNYQFSYYGNPEQVNEEVFISYRWPSIQAEE